MKRALLYILPCIISLYINSFAQSCTECKERLIIIYDNNVTIPEPDYGSMSIDQQLKAYKEWTDLYYIVGGVKKYINQDATTDCLVKLCSAFFTETDSINTTVRYGIGHPNLPPKGSVARGDYIICGTVSGGNGSYTLMLRLETAKSRELVKGSTINFSSGFNPFEVGFNAASGFGVLYNTCLDFEKKKRDEGEPYAIRPKMETIPEKTSLKKKETTSVEFTLKDCDEQPLKNRTIEISAENGTFDSQTITTDESGKARAIFTAGDNAGTAVVKATLVYRMPTELTSVSTSDGGTAYIEIEKSPDWKVKCSFAFEEKVVFDQVIENGAKAHNESFKSNTGNLYAVIDEKSWGNGLYSTNSTISENIFGMYIETYNERDLVNVSDDHTSVYSNTVKTNECTGYTDNDNQHVNVTLGSNDRHFAFTNNVSSVDGGGQSNSFYHYCQDGNCASNSSSDILDCGTSVYGDGTHSYETTKGNQDTSYTTVETPSAGTTITHKIHQILKEGDNKITFQYTDNGTSETISESAKQIVTTKESVTMDIFTGTLTGVDDKLFIPVNFLYQNNPNPFNPQTIINFSLGKAGQVKLSVFDILGREIRVLVNSYKSAGTHSVKFDASDLNSGVYFYRLEGNGFSSSKKMMLVK